MYIYSAKLLTRRIDLWKGYHHLALHWRSADGVCFLWDRSGCIGSHPLSFGPRLDSGWMGALGASEPVPEGCGATAQNLAVVLSTAGHSNVNWATSPWSHAARVPSTALGRIQAPLLQPPRRTGLRSVRPPSPRGSQGAGPKGLMCALAGPWRGVGGGLTTQLRHKPGAGAGPFWGGATWFLDERKKNIPPSLPRSLSSLLPLPPLPPTLEPLPGVQTLPGVHSKRPSPCGKTKRASPVSGKWC